MKLKATVLLSTLVLSGAVLAQAKAPEPDYTLSYNIGGVTEYRYRGISQSARKPALQGGIDFAHKSGFYLGTWASTIRWIKDSSNGVADAKGPVELDVYGGYKGAINDTFSYDVGGLEYWYVGNTYKNITGTNANTFELYGALTAGPTTVKYSHATTDLFGTPNSKGSGYLDVSATFDLGSGFSLVPHVGAQRIKNLGTYHDASLTLAKDWSGVVASAAVVTTDWAHKFGFDYTLPGTGTKNLAGTSLVLGIKKNF
ncbi:TorF family putative porin [Ramlibacter sp. MMS24-I3-19]|uniref:TorF family putative porin n=1 Tax=Ramlibacter sp. MMS24-I3-19 TaxID=3416606 RepID=UPI003D0769BF